jgi:hypothetical protein
MPDSAPTASTGPHCLAIVPAYNEEASIAAVVADLAAHAPGVDILVIDDGSADATAARVPAPARCIRLPFNLGIGAAMQTGYRFAALHGYDLAVQVDGDGQHPADQVGRLLVALGGGADMVIGSRFLSADAYRPSAARSAGIVLLRGLLRVLTGQRITDCTSGFRAVNRRVIQAFAHWYPDDYPEPEVVLLLHRAGFRVDECAIEMRPRLSGKTSIPLILGLFYVVKVSVALILDLVRNPWPPEENAR